MKPGWDDARWQMAVAWVGKRERERDDRVAGLAKIKKNLNRDNCKRLTVILVCSAESDAVLSQYQQQNECRGKAKPHKNRGLVCDAIVESGYPYGPGRRIAGADHGAEGDKDAQITS